MSRSRCKQWFARQAGGVWAHTLRPASAPAAKLSLPQRCPCRNASKRLVFRGEDQTAESARELRAGNDRDLDPRSRLGHLRDPHSALHLRAAARGRCRRGSGSRGRFTVSFRAACPSAGTREQCLLRRVRRSSFKKFWHTLLAT